VQAQFSVLTARELYGLEASARVAFFPDSPMPAGGDSGFTSGGRFAMNLLMLPRIRKETLLLNCAATG
jgi:hypothetical protein